MILQGGCLAISKELHDFIKSSEVEMWNVIK